MATDTDNRPALEWEVRKEDRGWGFFATYTEHPKRDGDPYVDVMLSSGPYPTEEWAQERLIEQAARFGLRLKDGGH